MLERRATCADGGGGNYIMMIPVMTTAVVMMLVVVVMLKIMKMVILMTGRLLWTEIKMIRRRKFDHFGVGRNKASREPHKGPWAHICRGHIGPGILFHPSC